MPSNWTTVEGTELQQGDYLLSCSVPVYPANFADYVQSGSHVPVPVQLYNLIILTQTCDLVEGRHRTDWVLLAPVFSREALIAQDQGFENANRWMSVVKGEKKGFCWLPPYAPEDGNSIEAGLVVYYRQTFCLPIEYIRAKATAQGARQRLNYPYLHALAQAFGELFTRPALPEPWNVVASQTSLNS